MQYVPEDGIYVYFRYNNEKTIMVVLNTNDQAKDLVTSRFSERIGKHQMGLNIITDQKIQIDNIKLPANTSYIFELQ